MSVIWANKVLVFGNPLHSPGGGQFWNQSRGSVLANVVRTTARNRIEKPLGRHIHAVIRATNTVAIRVYDTDVLTFTDSDITINYGNYKTSLTLSVINEFLPIYGFVIRSASRGPYKHEWFILPTPQKRLPTGQGGIRVQRSGTRISYIGVDLDEVGPDWDSVDFLEYIERSNRAKKLQNFVGDLGFYGTFQMGGYKLPKEKSEKTVLTLTKIAQQLGFHSVSDAWLNGGIMINDSLSDQDIEMLLHGGAKLLRSVREDQDGNNCN